MCRVLISLVFFCMGATDGRQIRRQGLTLGHVIVLTCTHVAVHIYVLNTHSTTNSASVQLANEWMDICFI